MLSTRISRLIVTAVVAALLVALVPVLHHAEAVGAGSIAYGQSVTGQISNQTYFELWQFQGARGDRVQIAMQGDGQLDPYLGLIDGASEEVLVEDDDTGGNGNAYIETTLTADGTYIIVATRYGFDTGTSQGKYQLSLGGGTGPQNVSETTTTTGAPQEISPGVFMMGALVLGTPTSGAISNDAYAQIYSLQLQQGTDLLVAMFADSSPLDCYIIFADQDGNVLAEDNNSGDQVDGSKTDAFLRLTIPQDGTYLVAATRAGVDTGTSTGNYVVIAATPEEQNTPQQQPDQQQAPAGVEQMAAIAAGQSANGTLDNNSFAHLYPFDGQANEQITITLTGSGGLDAYLGVIDPHQEVIAEDDDSGGGTNAQISIRLPESGTYVIVVTRNGIDQGTTQGSYTLTVTSGTPAAPTGVTGVGGFGGLPGRAFPVDGATFFLRGFGRSADPTKNSPLEGFFQGAIRRSTLPGRSFDTGNNESFYLSGFGKSEDPTKATQLQSYLAEFLGH